MIDCLHGAGTCRNCVPDDQKTKALDELEAVVTDLLADRRRYQARLESFYAEEWEDDS